MRRTLFATLLLVLAATAVVVKFNTGHEFRTVRMGFDEAAPYQSSGPDGRPIGFTVDILTEASKRTGVNFEWVHVREGPRYAFARHQVDAWPLVAERAARSWGLYAGNPWTENQYALVWVST